MRAVSLESVIQATRWPLARGRLVGVLALLALLAAMPALTSDFRTVLVTEILILALFAMSFNLLFGYTGLLSFGHAAYFGLGAYGAALILKEIRPSIPLALVGGTILATLAGLVIGYFCVRLDEIYFAMLTLAFAQMVFAIADKWTSVTGGSDGLVGIPRSPLRFLALELSIADIPRYYYFTLVLVVAASWVLWRIVNSPFGLTLKAIRESPERAEFTGIPVRHYRLMAFVLSAAFSGLAGAIFAPFERAITPQITFWSKSAEPVFMSLLGGMRIFLGPAVGSAIFMVIKEVISSRTEFWAIVLGAVLIALVIFLPGGIAHFAYARLNRWTQPRLLLDG
ncbi:MAG: branched-chain amino acid ABC transporter permease [Anaerolineae bacterium]